MHKKLEEILNKTREDLLRRKKQKPLSVILNEMKDIYSSQIKPVQNDNSFYYAMKNPSMGSIAIIAEVKFASPKTGKLGSSKQLLQRVKQYEQAKANAISIITEKTFFDGRLDFVTEVRRITKLPILQKDFVIDEYQICQSKLLGSDAILLIAKILSKDLLKRFVRVAKNLGVEPVVEINSQADLNKALVSGTKIIAVNARDLDTFEVNVDKACKLLKQVPDKFIKLGFSGVLGKIETEKYRKAGTDGILIGTSLMKTGNIGQFLSSLRAERSNLIKVKICGVRSKKAADVAIKNRADFLGFNFVISSKRYIDPKIAKKIIKSVKGKVKVVGVFQNSKVFDVNRISKELGLDFVQLHGSEDDKYISKIKLPVIKSITVNSKPNGTFAKYLLIDRISRGEGKLPDLKKSAKLAEKHPILFAGGLNPQNVAQVIKTVKPFGVDVAGGVETNGVQDLKKIVSFIKNVKGAI